MKKFVFKLDPALQWRSTQMKAHELLLQTLHRDHNHLGDQLRDLNANYARVEEAAKADASCNGGSLAALSRYRLSHKRLSANLSLRQSQLAAAIETQRAILLVAARDYELLVKLEARQSQEWKIDMNRRIDADASEAFLIRWKRK